MAGGDRVNPNPYFFAIVGVIVWQTFEAIRQGARDFQAADRYDVFAPASGHSGEFGDEDE